MTMPHPGEILREEFLKPFGLSAHKLATDLRVPATRINDITRERRGVSADTALRLARYFDTTPVFWMNLQSLYDLEVAEAKRGNEIRQYVKTLDAA